MTGHKLSLLISGQNTNGVRKSRVGIKTKCTVTTVQGCITYSKTRRLRTAMRSIMTASQ